ncbi:MAG: hypothetical protein Q9188_005516 [Gyalolechia gomerana]
MYSSGAFSALAFDNSDQVDGKDGQKRLICDANTIAAYTLNEDGGEHPRIHVCGRSWGYFPRLGELDVGKVCAGERVSEAKITAQTSPTSDVYTALERETYIQLSHAFDSPTPAHIRDIAYGPLNVRNLRKDPKTENDAVHNADNYMWFALVKNPLSSTLLSLDFSISF